MATFLDLSMLSGFSAIFSFLLIFSVIYAVLTFMTGMFSKKENKSLASIIAFSMAALGIFSSSFVEVIRIVTPWFVILMFAIVMVLLMSMIFGNFDFSTAGVKEGMGTYRGTVIMWITILSLIILLGGVGQVYLGGEESEFSLNKDGTSTVYSSARLNGSSTDASDRISSKGSGAALDTIFHPKILGVLVVLLIGAFTIKFMATDGMSD